MQLTYKAQIEALQEHIDYEARGDALFLYHEDVAARLEWAFYRPSGSHEAQVADPDVMVSIMAFNHSRLSPKVRFDLLHRHVIADDALRIKVRNRSRMLFRAMVDDDFWELVAVLEIYPQFWDLAYDQVQNGRIWNEKFAHPVAASQLLAMAPTLDEAFVTGVKRRLQRIDSLSIEEALAFLEELSDQAQKLHSIIREIYTQMFATYIDRVVTHPLQRIVWHKRLSKLNEERL